MKVYLDDERVPPYGWRLVKTPKEAIDLLKTGNVTDLSLDHDLGGDDTIGTGYDVLLWLEEQVYLNNFRPPKVIKVHSANVSARTKMEMAIKNINKKSYVGEITMKASYLRKIIKEEIKRVIKEGWNDHMDFELDSNDIESQKGKVDSYLFTVANDDEGRERIQRAKDGLSPFFKFRIRGRHSNRKEVLGAKWRPGGQNDISPQQAEYLAVYIDPK